MQKTTRNELILMPFTISVPALTTHRPRLGFTSTYMVLKLISN